MTQKQILVFTLSIVGMPGLGSIARAAEPSRITVPHLLMMEDMGDKKEEKKEEKKGGKEEKIAVDKLPAAVTEGVKKEMPTGTITDAEKETDDGKTIYELDVTVADTVYEVKVSEEGKVLSKEVDKEDTKEKK